MKIKAVIFDLDGTLIDSLKDIALSMNKVLQEFNLPTHKIEEYNYFVGDGAKVLTQNATPKNCDENTIEKVLERFKEVYDNAIYSNTKVYEGIYDLLDELQSLDLKLGILSNKPHEFTIKYAQKLLSDYDFKEIHGQREPYEKKPDPKLALEIISRFEINKDEVLYVGDTSTDIKTAKNANINSIGVTWGFRPKEELENEGATYIANTALDILDIIKNHK